MLKTSFTSLRPHIAMQILRMSLHIIFVKYIISVIIIFILSTDAPDISVQLLAKELKILTNVKLFAVVLGIPLHKIHIIIQSCPNSTYVLLSW